MIPCVQVYLDTCLEVLLELPDVLPQLVRVVGGIGPVGLAGNGCIGIKNDVTQRPASRVSNGYVFNKDTRYINLPLGRGTFKPLIMLGYHQTA